MGDDQPTEPAAPAVRTYYLAAEAVDWNYAPLGADPVFARPLPSPWGDTTTYRKKRYVQYTDETFTDPVAQPPSMGILGPLLHAAVGDRIEIVLANRTDDPVSIHPHGVQYAPDSEGAPYLPDDGDRGVVAPGETRTFHWRATAGSGPGADGPRSRVWLYHSHINFDEQIYQGLIGGLVITDPDHADADARPTDVDRELAALFFVFNEASDEDDEETAEGHLMHAINGRVFGNLEGLDAALGERVRWYLLALGTEVDLHTAHWHGHTVATESGLTTDVIELLPASMRTVDLVADNPGRWLLHCHVADHVEAGMYALYSVD